ncbi:MAG TPA: pyruvate, phosphate dikinase [bacterium]|nr:pyruvate, phosphate dikinase [bacterium]
MKQQKSKQILKLMNNLQERTKELTCLYQIEELLLDSVIPLEDLLIKVARVLPSGFQFPDVCRARVVYNNKIYQAEDFQASSRELCADIKVQGRNVGRISVFYIKEVPSVNWGLFLKEEIKLINTIADRISYTIIHKTMKQIYEEWEVAKEEFSKTGTEEWHVIVNMLRRTDKHAYLYISQKMLQHLCWRGVDEANRLMDQPATEKGKDGLGTRTEINRPTLKQTSDDILNMSEEVFRIASRNLSGKQILSFIHRWLQQDKLRFFIKTIDNPGSSLNEIIHAITRFQYIEAEGAELSASIEKGLRVSLIRRFLSEQLEFIKIAKKHIGIRDYYQLVNRIIYPANSRGKLGGKTAGLILASRILAKSPEYTGQFGDLRVPKTWFITSDSLINFMHDNNYEEMNDQKYKEIDEIAFEYPNIVQIFKNSHFAPEIVKGLSSVIDDFGNRPIIVRSSSLLEDRLGAAFSGKYKSLFLANQGSKEERLEALMDAIAEVYASTFSPDAILYRTERGLLDFHEEMGIMIQEVVGTQIGDYFLPTFAGVAFSCNEFRWSSRIRREDGLVRLVPGLGTRAVDRVSNDYPVLIAPGNPELRVNVTPDQILHYSPKMIDVINLSGNRFETLEISRMLKEFGNDIPGIHYLLSVCEENHLHTPTNTLQLNFAKDNLIVTFEGLVRDTRFISQIETILAILEKEIGSPVDIEFAHDGTNLYLLQCRPQSHSQAFKPASIPDDIPEENIIFSANRYISNGQVPDISTIVYVDPKAYCRMTDLSEYQAVGQAVGRLNMILPRRQFILIGPGRWGSRGDIKLGVSVTYSDINNTAMLIEIANKKGDYVPELSFGTHFFQDMVESSIRYLPLYPDEESVIFNERFLLESPNMLPEILPQYARLSDTIHVIDVPGTANGMVLSILMNGEVEKAVGYLRKTG